MLIWVMFECAIGLFLAGIPQPVAAAPSHPNVVIILTDDQGFGELGVTGNPVVRTPQIDRFAGQSETLTNFSVMPCCSPTRACLMTGRYYYRTGLTDTFMGRSLIDPQERTVAEMFAAAGYHTGIFGKWHLGDNYPRRAMDKGFQESLVLNGGGLAQPGDPPDPVDERGAYFNATMRHNGAWIKTDGYVSDVITKAAIEFIEKNRSQPFFLYLPFNCPHAPHQVPDEYRLRYPAKALAPANFPRVGNPMPAKQDPDDIARVYGMIENIDDNVGRLLSRLDELKLSEDTIVVLFSDNGCQHHNGYNAGLRDWKGSPYEGGIHQFCFLRWPGFFQPGRKVDPISVVCDVTPTLLDLCGIAPPTGVKFDGKSLAPLLRGEAAGWPDRTIVAQWHRGDAPDRYRNFSVRSQEWKLVQPRGEGTNWDGQTDFQLFDLTRDPYEMHNVAAEHHDQVAKLKTAYDAWFDDVTAGYDFDQGQRIYIGTPHENPVLLTRQDWRGPKASWKKDGLGYWEIQVATAGRYRIRLRFDAAATDGEAGFACGSTKGQCRIRAGADECRFDDVQLPQGAARMESFVDQGGAVHGANYVEVERME
jgi:arylsulfatase A-like enzyme